MDFDTIFTEDAKGIQLKSDKPLTIKVGSASITLNPSGEITLKGLSINIEGTTLKMNGQSETKLSAQGVITIKGALVKLN